MLVLSRRIHESIILECPDGTLVTVSTVAIRGDRARLGIEAPATIKIHRQEVYDAIQRERTSQQQQALPVPA